jgi:hypothetical protein
MKKLRNPIFLLKCSGYRVIQDEEMTPLLKSESDWKVIQCGFENVDNLCAEIYFFFENYGLVKSDLKTA